MKLWKIPHWFIRLLVIASREEKCYIHIWVFESGINETTKRDLVTMYCIRLCLERESTEKELYHCIHFDLTDRVSWNQNA